ncbi:hypothetical protein QJQ45_022417 [Haematococcus lacustris]|nr:hypothetical protein QJQ45_022417 [Haematococcus lacustris]
MSSNVQRSARRRREVSAGETDIERNGAEARPVRPARVNPIAHRWNKIPLFLFFVFLGSAAYYFVVRFQGLAVGGWQPYPLFIVSGAAQSGWARAHSLSQSLISFSAGALLPWVQICLELVGQTAFLPYAILLLRSVYPTGSPGLPPRTDREASTAAMAGMTPRTDQTAFDCRLHVRVLVPCYKEPMEVVVATIMAAVSAGLPSMTRRQVDRPISTAACQVDWLISVALEWCLPACASVLPLLNQSDCMHCCYLATYRTVYLCDDGKDAEKAAFIEALSATEDVVYVSGRTRKKGEVNGKSANLNFCLHKIYASLPRSELNPEDVDWSEISNKELVVVFDSDMCAKPDFFCKASADNGDDLVLTIMEVMLDDNIALCLTPQAFHNIDPDTDLFNSINVQFWEYWLPGAFAWGYIACTGTNFCIRARALSHCGWFPEYTITEDYALGMELKSRGYKATYLNDYIAVGELPSVYLVLQAPEEIRNVFRQRSRWTKGHFQVFFSGKCPLLNFELPFFQRLWYSYAAWAPITTMLTVPAFIIVPFMSIAFGIHPVTITYELVLASTLYFVSQNSLQYYVHTLKHLKLMWFVNVSNTVLWFTFTKAFVNTMAAKMGFKAIMFKVTDKTKGDTAAKPAVVPTKGDGKDGDKAAMGDLRAGSVLSRLSQRVATAVYSSFTRQAPLAWTHNSTPSQLAPAQAQPAGKSRLAHAGRDMEPQGALAEEGDGYQPHVQTWLNRNTAEAHQPRSRNASLTSASDDTPRYASSVYSGGSVPRRARQPSDDHTRALARGVRPVVPAPTARPLPAPVRSDSPNNAANDRSEKEAWAEARSSKGAVPSGQRLLVQAASNRSVTATSAGGPAPSRRPEASGSHTVSYREALPMMACFAGVGGADDRTLTAPIAMASQLVVVVEGSDIPAPPDSPDLPDAAPPASSEPQGPHPGPGSAAAAQPNVAASWQPADGSVQYAVEYTAAAVGYNPGLLSQTSLLSGPQVYTASEARGGLPHVATRPIVLNPAPIHVLPVAVDTMNQSLRESQQQRLPAPWEMSAWEDQLAKKVMQQVKEKGALPSNWMPRSKDKKDDGKSKPGERLARFKTVMASFKPANVQDFGKMFDPLALLILWLLCLVISLVGMWELSQTVQRNTLTSFALNSPLYGNPYLMIAICWSFYNSIAPYCFLHYCFSAGKTFKFMTKLLPGVSTVVLLGSIILLWMLIPSEFDVQAPLTMSLQTFLPNQVMRDTNMAVMLVSGVAAAPLSLPALLGRGPTDPLPFITTTAMNSTAGRHLLQSEVPDLVSKVNLLGGLTPGVDPVKYAQPSAYTLTMLAWSLLQFPQGFTAQQAAAAKQTIRQVLFDGCRFILCVVMLSLRRLGADYLMRCNLNPADPRNPVYVAQLGDPSRYVLDSHPGYFPAAEGKVWTHTTQDPALTGDLPRPAWVLTRENPGADLLSGVAAALSAASLVLKDDADWASLALTHARYLYTFGTSQSLDPKPACATLPCTTDIEVEEQVTAVPLVSDYDGTPKCYWADWNAKTCRVAYTSAQCDALRSSLSDVFINKQGCCDIFVAAKVWSITYTGAQGICALPENQTTCYVPDRTQRTCYEQTVNLETGVGCSGVGIEVFPTTLGCCTYLNTLSIVATTVTATGQVSYGQGLCARVGTDPAFRRCFVPSIVNSTCMELTGPACAQYGGETSFDEPIGCCNRLTSMLAAVSIVRPIVMTGVCTRGGAAPSGQTVPTAAGKRLRRGLQSDPSAQPSYQQLWSSMTTYVADSLSSTRRRLLQSTASTTTEVAPASSTPMTQSQLQTLSLATLLASMISPMSGSSSGGSGLMASLSGLLGGRPSTSSNATQWPLPQASDVLEYDPCAAGTCRIMTVNRTKTVPFFNSTTVLDDMAWGAVWMYRATKEAKYLGQAELFLKRHKQVADEEMAADSLQFTRQYYVPDWDNVAWATEVLLANITNSNVYHERLRSLLSTWAYADSLPTAPSQPSQIKARTNLLFNLQDFTDATTNSTFAIVPDCRPRALYEVNCYDGIDDDCNGLVDKEDTACGLFPTLYTPRQVAFSSAPSLPNAATAAFLALAYSKQVPDSASIQLRCWSLSQAGHMLGTGVGENSYIVGFGTNPPTIVQHRDSSCPTGAANCTWSSGFYPTTANPQLQLIQGALVAGPGLHDEYTHSRTNNQTQVSAVYNAAFTGLLAGLVDTSTTLRSCEALHGVWQRYVTGEDNI